MELTEEDKVILLSAARESINSVFTEEGYPPTPDYNQFPNLKQNCGAFVTLRINNDLRGCIGYIFSQTALFETVCDAAKQSAFSDPRFFPLSSEELNKVDIEISVLSIPVYLNSYNDIKLGIHGLLLEEGSHKSVLLPQVATENNLSIEEFLSILCEKAGLSSQIWKIKMLNLKSFEAQVFSEEEIMRKENE
ncbi:MAG: AmmeMemoRadiSam system protein A [Candidatus Thorarchaeota archaeon]